MRASVSQIKMFKACRQAWFLKYHEHLIPRKPAEALECGTRYHALIEDLYSGAEVDGLTREHAMAEAYKRYIMPSVPIVKPELELKMPIGHHELFGIIDGVAEDGRVFEHKTTSMSRVDFEQQLEHEEQPLAYMLLTGKNQITYTVCKKPTIRKKQSETDEEFFERMVEWYAVSTDDKIYTTEVMRTSEDIERFAAEFHALCEEIEKGANLYHNPAHCQAYGRPCEYWYICNSYSPDVEYIEFERNK